MLASVKEDHPVYEESPLLNASPKKRFDESSASELVSPDLQVENIDSQSQNTTSSHPILKDSTTVVG